MQFSRTRKRSPRIRVPAFPALECSQRGREGPNLAVGTVQPPLAWYQGCARLHPLPQAVPEAFRGLFNWVAHARITAADPLKGRHTDSAKHFPGARLMVEPNDTGMAWAKVGRIPVCS